MKSQINKIRIRIALVLLLCCFNSTASFAGVQVDPALTFADEHAKEHLFKA